MSSKDIVEAARKLEALSDERADKVVSLIEDLAELEALENAEDLKDAREALAEMQQGGANASAKVEFSNTADDALPERTSVTIPYEQLRRELGLDK